MRDGDFLFWERNLAGEANMENFIKYMFADMHNLPVLTKGRVQRKCIGFFY